MAPTAVDVSELTATQQDDHVAVAWQTTSEVEIVGFNVWRRDHPENEYVRINDATIWATTPGGSSSAQYTWHDVQAPTTGALTYRLEVLKADGGSEPYGEADITIGDVPEPQALYLPVVMQ